MRSTSSCTPLTLSLAFSSRPSTAPLDTLRVDPDDPEDDEDDDEDRDDDDPDDEDDDEEAWGDPEPGERWDVVGRSR
jgi:hypothetical protein